MHTFHNDNYAPQYGIVFDKFSLQYQCIIIGVIHFILFCQKSLTLLLKFSRIGIFVTFIYGVFLIYALCDNFINNGIGEYLDDYKLFTKDVGQVSGSFSICFFMHSYICQITANNKKWSNNVKDTSNNNKIFLLKYQKLFLLKIH